MLISYYALLIFALTSSVVAPSSQQPSGSAWQTLQGNTDPRLRDVEDPNGVVYRWYQLQEDKPTWPKDAKLDRFMEFIPVDGRVERVACFKFQRITTPDQLKIHVCRTGYDLVRKNRVNDPLIALAGYWGRAKGLNVSDNLVEAICSASRSSLQNLPEGTVGPVVLFDEVIEIKKTGFGTKLKREIRFLNKKSHANSALTVYDLLPRPPIGVPRLNPRQITSDSSLSLDGSCWERRISR